jgi:hypothetical protein
MTNFITEEREIKTREDLIDALYEAAELEHSLCCLYLFAAFSLKRHPDEGNVTWAQIEKMREWEMRIFRIARQEMEHLGYVCNLLTAIGGAPHLRRPNFPTNYYDAKITFDLAPFSTATLKNFVRYERPENPSLNRDSSGLRTKYGTIGELYHKIERGFEDLDKRAEPLFIGPPSAQIISQDFPGFYHRPTAYQIEINKVVDRMSAKKAIDQIVIEGEGSPSDSDNQDSHYQTFKSILDELNDELNADKQFQPARPVVTNPVVSPDSITHPATTAAMNLFDAAYEIMLMLLIRIFSHIDETAEEVLALERIAFFPMMTMVIRPLGEVLTQLPTAEPDVGSTAGPNFKVARDLTLLPHKQPAWIYLHERLQELAEDCQNVNHQISTLPAELKNRISPRLLQLQTNLEILAVNVYRYLNRPEQA